MPSAFSDEDLERLPRADLAALYLSAIAARDALQEQLAAAQHEADRLGASLRNRLADLGRGQALISAGHAFQVGSDGSLKFVRLVSDEPAEASPPLRLAPPDDAGDEGE